MNMDTLRFCIREGFRNLKRNRLFNLASVVTIAACVFLFGLVYSVMTNLRLMAQEAEGTVGITVFFETDLTEEEILAVGEQISSNGLVDRTEYTSAEEAWTYFKDKYFADSPELAEGFADDNPLADSASFTVYLKDPNRQADAVRWIEGLDGVRKATYSELAANGIRNLRRLIGTASTAFIGLLFAISLFLIRNTISLAYAVRKNEIELMKYIGATNLFVRTPFLVEGITIGLIGAILPILPVCYIYANLSAAIVRNFAGLSPIIRFAGIWSILKILIPVSLLIGVSVGFFGSFFTIRKELKV